MRPIMRRAVSLPPLPPYEPKDPKTKLKDSSDEEMSSPARVKLSNVISTDAKIHREIIRQEFEGCYVENVPIMDFVLNVWELPVETAQQIYEPAVPWEIPTSFVNEYKTAAQTKEPDMYRVFVNMTHAVVEMVAKALGTNPIAPEEQNRLTTFWEGKGTTIFVNPRGTQRKPDVCNLTSKWAGGTPLWSQVRNPGEFKKHGATGDVDKGRKGTHSHADGLGSLNFHLSRSASPPAARSLMDAREAAKADIRVGKFGRAALAAIPEAGGSDLKRKHSTEDDGQEDVFTSKRQRRDLGDIPTTALSNAHAQLTTYMAECLASSSRFFNVGFHVDGAVMTLLYSDHMMGFRSRSFHILDELATFALVMYTMQTCKPRQAGFNPFLHRYTRSMIDANPSLADHFVESMEGEAYFNFPIRKSSKLCLFGSLVEFDPTVLTQYCTFKVQDTIFYPHGLTGRCTGVYETWARLAGWGSDPKLSLKGSWQTFGPYREPEADLILHLRGAVPVQYCENLPEVLFSDVYTAEELQLPSIMMSLTKPYAKDPRAYHILSSRVYKKLRTLKSIEEFKKVWLECVRCHHAAWKAGKVLHRDLSENNIMYKRNEVKGPDDQIIEEDPIGILNDWDMASRLKDKNYCPKSSAHHRTGTLPFMALDLCVVDKPPHHQYRHDLESFFYVLLWASVYYSVTSTGIEVPTDLPVPAFSSEDVPLGSGGASPATPSPTPAVVSPDPTTAAEQAAAVTEAADAPATPVSVSVVEQKDDPLKLWKSDNIRDVQSFKTLFIHDPSEILAKCVRPEWSDVRDAWIQPLVNLFSKLHTETVALRKHELEKVKLRLKKEGKGPLPSDYQYVPGQKTIAKLDAMVNYKTFLEAINEKVEPHWDSSASLETQATSAATATPQVIN